jgi:uncharacterized Zn finger protein
MNRRDRFGWPPPVPKQPPPQRGIRMKKAGTTWWGQRWIEALEHVLGGSSGRLARGRTYARAGRTHDLVVNGGQVLAKVTGLGPEPYAITITLTELSAAAWKRAIDALATKAQFSAELLAGRMPETIDQVFSDLGLSLFPRQRNDLKTSCSCPDWGDPCKHVAATHYVLGEALDRDPFLLFELRGRTKDQVLDALRAARGGVDETPKNKKRAKLKAAPDESISEIPTVSLGKLSAVDYDKPREALPALHFSFHEPVSHGAVLQQLGTPTDWQSDASPADVLAPLVRAAADTARRIALAEPSEPDARSPGTNATPAQKSRRQPRPRTARGKEP